MARARAKTVAEGEHISREDRGKVGGPGMRIQRADGRILEERTYQAAPTREARSASAGLDGFRRLHPGHPLIHLRHLEDPLDSSSAGDE